MKVLDMSYIKYSFIIILCIFSIYSCNDTPVFRNDMYEFVSVQTTNSYSDKEIVQYVDMSCGSCQQELIRYSNFLEDKNNDIDKYALLVAHEDSVEMMFHLEKYKLLSQVDVYWDKDYIYDSLGLLSNNPSSRVFVFKNHKLTKTCKLEEVL